MSRFTLSVAESIDPTVRYAGTVDPNKNYTFCNTMNQNPKFHFYYLGNIILNEEGLPIPHGKGKYIYGDGPNYTIHFNRPTLYDRDRQRMSTYCPDFTGGSTYEGDIRDGKLNGYGIHKDSNGDIYEGHFVDNSFSGDGIFSFSNGDTYKGQLVDNKIIGNGKYTWANGNTYEGQFENGNPHGYGTFIWANHGNSKKYAKKYVGRFKNGNMTNGSLTFNKIYTAHFENNGEYLELIPNDMVTIRTINGRFIKKTGHFIIKSTPGRTPGRTPRRTPRRTPGRTQGRTQGRKTRKSK